MMRLNARCAVSRPDPPRPQMRRRHDVLPGFGLTLGFSLFYLCLVVLLPLSALTLSGASFGWDSFWRATTAPRVLASYRLTFTASLGAALVNAVFGLVVAWVLVRYRFPGRRVADALVDLPFALPTAVAGIALTSLYAETGWLGRPLASLGLRVAFTPVGIGVALTFIGLPFVVRTLQPVLETLDPEVEEAASSLGASPLQSITRVVLPAIAPAWLSGVALAFARALGEYGSVVFISGNMPLRTEIAPLVLMTKLEQYDYAGATAVALTLLAVSFLLLGGINLLQSWSARRVAVD
jgi:sulfate transport system permease protein